MPGIRQQYRDLIALHGVMAREEDAHDSVVIGPANMYRLAAAGRGPELSLTESSFTGAVLYLAGHRDPAALAGHHTMLHETLHTCGPTPNPAGDSAVAVEELVTELATREVLRLAGSTSTSSCYQDLIERAAAEFGGDRGIAITALAASALQIKREMRGMRGSYQVIGALLAMAGCDVVAGCSDRIISAFTGHWTQTLDPGHWTQTLDRNASLSPSTPLHST